jgi:hypothetical protein
MSGAFRHLHIEGCIQGIDLLLGIAKYPSLRFLFHFLFFGNSFWGSGVLRYSVGFLSGSKWIPGVLGCWEILLGKHFGCLAHYGFQANMVRIN